MRTFEEIQTDIAAALTKSDLSTMATLAEEMASLNTPSARASSEKTHGTVSLLSSDYESALRHYGVALLLYEELDDNLALAGVVGNIGNAYMTAGDYPRALEQCERALSIYMELGALDGQANFLGSIGAVYHSSGDLPKAIEYYKRSIQLSVESGYERGRASAINNMATAYFGSADYAGALENYETARDLYRELGDQFGVFSITTSIVSTLLKLSRVDEAVRILEEQADITFGNPVDESLYHANRSLVAELEGDLDEANSLLLHALSLASESGAKYEEADFHERMRDLAQKRNDFESYIKHNTEFLRITEEIRGKEATEKLAVMGAERTMESERREREKERALLYGALPESVANRMLKGEDVSGDHHDNASVMFMDIAGFTTNSDQLEPRVVTDLLDSIFDHLDHACEQHGVTKIKTIGDAYLAVAFDDVAEDQGVEERSAAVALAALKRVFTWPDGSPLQFRIGLHSGPVVAGVIGKKRLQYDVWGDTVNVASRMESSGEAGRIQVSEVFARSSALQAKDDRVEFVERGEIDIKGKGKMKTFWLEGALR